MSSRLSLSSEVSSDESLELSGMVRLSSEVSSDQSLELSGMAYRYRMRWNIPIKTFIKDVDVSLRRTVLCRSSFFRIEGDEGLKFHLELALETQWSSFYSLRIHPDSYPERVSIEVYNAFVVVNDEAYSLDYCPEYRISNQLYPSVLQEVVADDGRCVEDMVTMYFIIRVARLADMELKQDNNNPDSLTIGCPYFGSELMRCENADMVAFDGEGKLPRLSIDSADSLLKLADEHRSCELKPLISNYLQEQLSKETMIDIMRIAIDNDLKYLQQKVLCFMETKCDKRFE